MNYSSIGQNIVSRLTNINAQWEYLEDDAQSIDQVKESKNWQSIDLPHTWNSEDATDLVPGYRRSGSWYKKDLVLTPEQKSRYFLYFECANSIAEIYVNGVLSGRHIGGYVGFEIEITRELRAGQNQIMVRVDNGHDPHVIPSHQSDFFIFGGITRDVWLKKVNETFISDLTIRTPEVNRSKATTNIDIDLNSISNPKDLSVKAVVKDPKGKVVFEKNSRIIKGNSVSFNFSTIKPTLWDVDAPLLYAVEITLSNGQGIIDKFTETYGYRWFEFKEHGPFYLNGRRLVLRGTHRHEEMAGYGAAMPNALHRKDMESIKEMGVNFVRLGHYPQDPEVYKACDELGILIWDELPWCRGGVGDAIWQENTKNFLVEMIDQNFNHPSVIIWSLGNEMYWLPEFEDGDNPDKMNAFLNELNDIAHSMDSQRKTAIRKYYEGSHIVDVFSPSIWSGWYSGNYKNYEKVVNNSIEKYPHFLHMEYGGSSHVGRHSENPITGEGLVNPDEWEEPVNQIEVTNIAQSGDWSENYIVDLFDWHLRVSETNPKFTGNAQWAFRDFGTPLRPENDIPYMNQKGVMDRAGNPKDAYYVFKSYWSKDPFAYIESHTWTERSGPAQLPRTISVFSNMEKVEFFLNEVSLGVRARDINSFPACGLHWDVDFKEGENRLKAKGFKNGKPVTLDSMALNYTYEKSGSPEALQLAYELLTNGNYLVSATAIDIAGHRCLDYEERVYFQCLSGGKLMANMGTATTSPSIKMANGKASIEVVPLQGKNKLSMTVLNQNFKGTFLEIQIKATP